MILRTPAPQHPKGGWGFPAAGGALAALVIAGGVQVLTEEAFRGSFFANFWSTVAGVAVGVPVAIWLTMRESVEQREAIEKAAQDAEDARRREVLTAVRKELCEDRVTLRERRPCFSPPARSFRADSSRSSSRRRIGRRARWRSRRCRFY